MWSGVLKVPNAKTAERGARLQSVLIEDVKLLELAQIICGADPPNYLLVPVGFRGLQRRFDLIKKALGLCETPFTLGSLRVLSDDLKRARLTVQGTVGANAFYAPLPADGPWCGCFRSSFVWHKVPCAASGRVGA